MNGLVKNRIIVTGSNGMLGQRTVEFYSTNEKVELLATSVEEKSVIGKVLKKLFMIIALIL